MSTIFISHSNKDSAPAKAMQRWLQSKNHQSVFLDFDPANGIPAGRNWERELYQQLRSCRAVIALLSENWLASRWCFTEVTQARALGKVVIPVRVAECDASAVLPDVQQIDLTADEREGFQRLEAGLKRAGLDPEDMFHWDGRRPPYPGLLAFQEQDAAVFFGRDDDIAGGLDTLGRLRRLGGARLVLFLGASGSGKSSLVRAGLLPRLKRDTDNWLPVQPFRPQERPLEELALALAESFGTGQPKNWQEIRAELRRAADADPPDGTVVIDLVRELQIAANRREATVLLILDQTEELFGYGRSDEANRFLRLMRAGLEAAGSGLMIVATMRSDFLGEFQTHSELRDLEYQAVTVDPMSAENLPTIIEGPAEVGGIELGPGLTAAMLQDTTTDDALPLLAFTLRELYERYGDDGRLELDDYQELGGLEASVRRAADGVIQTTRPSEGELSSLRGAFVPAMVRINDEGQYARRRTVRADLPQRVQALLQQFVDARLLVSDLDKDGQETLEVAHEALLRAWPRLRSWLDEDQDKLRLRETLRRAAEEWHDRGREEDWLDHRGSRLAAAEDLMREPRFALHEETERDYLQACLDRRRREQEQAEAEAQAEQERREREARAERDRLAAEAQAAAEREAAARKITQRTRIGLAASLCLMVAAAGAGGYAYSQRVEAENQTIEAENQRARAETQLAEAQRNQSLRLAALSGRKLNERDWVLAALLALEALPREGRSRPVVSQAEEALFQAVISQPLAILGSDDGGATAATFGPDGARIVTASEDGTVRIWDAAAGKQTGALEGHEDAVNSAAFSQDGEKIVTASSDDKARIWNAESGNQIGILKGHYNRVNAAAFSPDGKKIVTASSDSTARLWETASQREIVALTGHDDEVNSAAFSPDGQTIVTASSDRTARLWETASGREVGVLAGHKAWLNSASFSPDGQKIVTASEDATVRIWETATRTEITLLKADGNGVWSAAFSPDGTKIVTASSGGTVRLWDAATGKPIATLKRHNESVWSAAFSADGQRIVTASDDIAAAIWKIPPPSGEPLTLYALSVLPLDRQDLTTEERQAFFLAEE